MLTLFVHAVACFSHVYEKKSTGLVTKISDFGFERRARFNFSLKSSQTAKLRIILINQEATNTSMIYNKRLCEMEVEIPGVQYSDPITKGLYANWVGTVQNAGIYDIKVLNCIEEKSVFTLTADIDNLKSKIDTRYYHHEKVYSIAAVMHFVIGMSWLITNIYYHIKNKEVYISFSLFPIMRSTMMLLYSLYWHGIRRSTRDFSVNSLIYLILMNVCRILFTVELIMTFSGLFTVRKSMTHREMLEIFPNCIALIVCIALAIHMNSVTTKGIFIGCAFVSSLWLLKFIGYYILSYQRIYINYECNYETREKVKHLLILIILTTIMTPSVAFLDLVVIYLYDIKYLPIVIEESYVLILEIGQALYFVLNPIGFDARECELKEKHTKYDAVA